MIGAALAGAASPRFGPATALRAAGLAFGLGLAATAHSEAADEASAPEGPVEHVEVRDDADRLGATLDPTAFATVIRAADFADRVTTVEELLRDSVGVQVNRTGSGFATVSIRGSTAEQVMVYLDGVPLNRALGGGVNLADLPLAQIESIEVYRGFTPASLSAASIGGAIVINTRDGSGPAGGTASATVGSFNSAEGTYSYAGKHGRGQIAAGLDAATSDGDFNFINTNGTLSITADDFEERRTNNGFDRLHLSGRYSVPIGAATRFRVSTDLLDRRQGVAGSTSLQSEDARFENRHLIIRPEFETVGLAGGHLLLRGALDYTHRNESFDDVNGDFGRQVKTDHTLTSAGAEVGMTLVASAHQAISLLASHRRETADLRDELSEPSDLADVTRHRTTLVVEDQIALVGGRLLLNPSLRFENYDSEFQLGSAGGAPPEEPRMEDSDTNGKIGMRLEIRPGLEVRGNYGSFLRLPDFLELFGNSGAVLGNPLLEPERGRNFDLGVVSAGARSGRLLNDLRLEVAYFETRADNLIQFEPTAQLYVVARNTGRARVQGSELSFSFSLGRRFNGSLNATHQIARNVSGDTNDGNLLLGRPRDELSTRMELQAGRGRFFHAFTYVGRNFIDKENTESLAIPARYVHDLGYSIALPHRLTLGLEIRNVGDEEIYDIARFPLPGRSFAGRIAWAY